MSKNPVITTSPVIPIERIAASIYLIRSVKVMPDSDLSELYGVETKRLKEQVKRNIERFPSDFMFQLTEAEFENLRSQIATSSERGGRRTPPYAFSNQLQLKQQMIFKNIAAMATSSRPLREKQKSVTFASIA